MHLCLNNIYLKNNFLYNSSDRNENTVNLSSVKISLTSAQSKACGSRNPPTSTPHIHIMSRLGIPER